MNDKFVLPWGLDYCKCGKIKRQNIDKICVNCKLDLNRLRIRKLKIKKLLKNDT